MRHVPPRAAHTPQVPVFFNETLPDNLLLGMPERAGQLSGALHAAVLEKDIATLDDGLETQVGPRGVGWFGGTLSLQKFFFLGGVGHELADTAQKEVARAECPSQPPLFKQTLIEISD
ncbi:MAG TPA: hypothetical protein VFU22_25625 [Roseiflexaceae bacterium]|nr:hypothetical protein [Roseiflexaceae bacterium]